jgi:hypothetical protein
MLPMRTFDPSKPCKVHDVLNDCIFDWKPEWAEHYRAHAQPLVTSGFVAWDGLLLDGWLELSPSIVGQ